MHLILEYYVHVTPSHAKVLKIFLLNYGISVISRRRNKAVVVLMPPLKILV